MPRSITGFNVAVKDAEHSLYGLVGRVLKQRSADGKLVCEFDTHRVCAEAATDLPKYHKTYTAVFSACDLEVVRSLKLLGVDDD